MAAPPSATPPAAPAPPAPVPDTTAGLTTAQVETLRAEHGWNEIPEKEVPFIRRLLRRFWGPIPWMIEIAAVLSGLVRKWEDLAIILVLLLVNVVIDMRQEAKALGALRLLKQRLARRALVRRDGRWREIAARELVPGDVIKLRLGNIVPADATLVGEGFLQLDQSALTGESLPVDAQAGDAARANAIVRKGAMVAIVTATGPHTYFGRTVSLVARAGREQRSHFQQAVVRVGNFLILLAAAMVVVIVMTALFRHDPVTEILRFALVLTIASIPVALPAVLSVTMAVGAVRLARRQAIVSRLVAIEELAGVDVLCCDKTGTLTQNRMALGEPALFNGFERRAVLELAALASREEDGDPLETPIFAALREVGGAETARPEPTRFLPFDPASKRTEAEFDDGRIVTKGAPQAILALCPAEPARAGIEARVRAFAQQGDRTLGVAVRAPGASSFRFAALLPFFDPPRDDSAELVATARELGVDIKMITGDNLAIAARTAEVLGIPGTVQDAAALHGRVEDVEAGAGFAQVLPEDKYVIVDRLQQAGHIVGMTGDGVNDAPALRKADAGVAVSGATDAARAAADVVLLHPGLGVIVEAMREARRIFARMQSYAIFRIAETVRVILFMTLAITVFNFYPVTTVMIIILALLNDIPIMAIAYDNARADDAPVRWDMKEVLAIASVLGLLGVTSSFLLFYLLESADVPRDVIQAIMFLKLGVAGHSTLYVARTRDRHFWHRPLPSLKLFVPAFSTQIVGTLIACYGVFMAPVGWTYVAGIWVYATAWFIVNDFVKVHVYRLLRHHRHLPEAQAVAPA